MCIVNPRLQTVQLFRCTNTLRSLGSTQVSNLSLYQEINRSVARQCVHCYNGDAASQWEMAILGYQNSVTPEPID